MVLNMVLMKEWIDALESGKYSQTTDRLRKNGGYCCLGVLCDISGEGYWDGSSYLTGVKEVDDPAVSATLIPINLFVQSGEDPYYYSTFSHNSIAYRDTVNLSIPPWLIPKVQSYYPEYASMLGERYRDMRLADFEFYENAATLNDAYHFTFREIAECVRYTFRNFL